MRTSRLEAFSDGVLAIIITIMILELKIPAGATLHALGGSASGFFTYLLSFVYVGIYWNNHHHMFQVVDRIDGLVLWANLHLLFWLSLFPVTTSWIDQEKFARLPVIVYGAVLLLAALAYFVLQLVIFRTPGGAELRRALGRDAKASSHRCCTWPVSASRSWRRGCRWRSSPASPSCGWCPIAGWSATSPPAKPRPRRADHGR